MSHKRTFKPSVPRKHRKSTVSRYKGLYVVAKFYLSKAPDGKLNCISRTLGKFSILDTVDEEKVGNHDVWICKILREIKPNENEGAFVLRPLEKIDADKRIRKLIPGFFKIKKVAGAALIIPNTDPADCWILSKRTREVFSKKHYALIVPIAYSEELVAKTEAAQALLAKAKKEELNGASSSQKYR